jgi:hypothetical protein
MRKDMLSKTLVMGVIVLFIGISTIPEINAVDTDTDDVVDKSIDNFEIRSFDDYEEIFTWFIGDAHLEWINKSGPNSGEVIIFACGWCRGISYFGLRHVNGLKLPYWGRIRRGGLHITSFTLKKDTWFLMGYAIGNIEYSEY